MSAIALEEGSPRSIFDTALQIFTGPFFICCTVALSFQRAGNFDLGLLCLLGLGLCIKLHRRGLFYSVALLFGR